MKILHIIRKLVLTLSTSTPVKSNFTTGGVSDVQAEADCKADKESGFSGGQAFIADLRV